MAGRYTGIRCGETRHAAPSRLSNYAHDRTRTCTPFPALVPQTSLSTNSSTWALGDNAQERTLGLPRVSEAMLEEGFEPSRGFPHRILNPARLPIPPPEHADTVEPDQPSDDDGAEGNRTPDLLNAIQALSQLSYGPSHDLGEPSGGRLRYVKHPTSQAGLTRLELATSGVTDRHSNRLSYSPFGKVL